MPAVANADSNRAIDNSSLEALQLALQQKNAEIASLQAELTQEREKYLELEKSQPDYWDQLKKVLDLAPIMVYIADAERLLYASSVLIEKLGYTPDECIGMASWWLIAPEYREIMKYSGFARMSGVNATPYEIKLMHKDGRQLFGLLSSERIVYEGRDAVIGFIQDIDIPKQMEEEIKRAARLEAMGVLAGGIAHDFNNMLTVIQGNNSLLKSSESIAAKDVHLLNEIEAATEEAQLLTNQLMSFSKEGGTPLMENVSLQEFVYDLVNLHIRGASVKCNISLPDDLWSANVDRGQIGQVIQNLVINACQAMPQGGIMNISAANEQVDEGNDFNIFPGPYVRVIIADHGIGIEPEIIDKIFDPYYTTKPGGHGLGLATVYSIIMKHAGAVRVESTPGEGTSFILMLPAADELPQPHELDPRKFETGEGCVMVMEDEGLVRNTLGRMLNHLGYQVVFARHGAEAIAKYEYARRNGQNFTAVIMDLTIAGGMGALPTLAELKKMDPDICAILTSGYNTGVVINDYKSYGFCGLVPKPYRLETLSKALHEVFGQSPGSAE